VTGGDILFTYERSVDNDLAADGGAILAVDKNGNYKGVVVQRDADNEILRYPRGLKLEVDNFDSSLFYLSVGTTNSSLKMEVHSFTEEITSTGSTRLTTPSLVTNTSGVSNSFFDFGFTTDSSGYRYITDVSGSNAPLINFYFSSGTLDSCKVDYGAGYAGWRAEALYSGMTKWVPVHVARTNSGDIAVDTFTHCTNGGADPTPNFGVVSESFGSDVKATDLFEFFSFGGDWHEDVFLTFTLRLGGTPQVYRYDKSAGYAKDTSPFTNTAHAAFYQSNGGVDKTIWTLESDASNRYLRSYDASGSLISTIFTDSDESVLPALSGGLGVWLVVVPE
jgi:hypothetical protein